MHDLTNQELRGIIKTYLPSTWMHRMASECLRRREEATDNDASFQFRWDADMRAIKRWQKAHPGREKTWPDHADLVGWLLEQLESPIINDSEKGS